MPEPDELEFKFKLLETIRFLSSSLFPLILLYPSLIAWIIEFIFLRPIYSFIIGIWGENTIGKKKVEQKFYAGLADWYIDELLSKDVEQFKTEEIIDLQNLYNRWCY